MNELLVSELQSEKVDLIEALALVEKFIFATPNISLDLINEIAKQCQESIEGVDEPLEQASHLINELFIEHIFIENEIDTWPSLSFKINESVDNRMIAPMLKAVIIRHIIAQCGFETDVVFVPEKPMIRIVCDEVYAIVFDPVTGESLNGFELDQKLEEVDADPYRQQLTEMNGEAVVIKYLTSLKAALIREGKFDQALKCVDILLAMRPDDPLERRDRGFLLHQLDCFKVAYDDYRYFVEQCPKDPAAKLLKLQLDNIDIQQTILH